MDLQRTGTLLAVTLGLGHLQSMEAQPAFEVASIKLSGPQSIRGSDGGPGSSDPGRYRYQSATLLDLIATAYEVEYFQVSSKAPLDRRHFDLVAKLPEGSTRSQFHVMLQNLLAERFHLKLHQQSRDFPAYALVIAKTGSKLRESDGAAPASIDGFPDMPAGRPALASINTMSGGFAIVRMRGQKAVLTSVVRMLRMPDERPVVDKTGLTGKYDFTLEFSKELAGAARTGDVPAPSAPNVFVAVEQQLGLQLIPGKLPFDFLVIESFDKLPTEN